MGIPLYVICCFSLAAFNVFSLYLIFFVVFNFWLRCVFVTVLRLFSSYSEQGLLFVAVRGLLIVVASLVVEHRL